MADFVASLERPRRVLIMVKAGAGTDAVIDELTPLMEDGDIVIDAGNAHFPDTIRREAKLAEIGLALCWHRRFRWRGGRAERSVHHAWWFD
jgi:6-phosphogluconate dehydrogenase